MLKGILSAYHLGHDFNRVVCVEWKAFLTAFQPPHQELCKNLKDINGAKKTMFYNFGSSMKWDEVQKVMSSDAKVVIFTGNSGRNAPRMPELFVNVFVPTKQLEDVIPWKEEPPKCVVHLRKGDNSRDKRRGLEQQTFALMKEKFDKDCYLITNNQHF